MDLDQVLTLRRAGIYAHPQDPNAILPRSFGNFQDPDATDIDPDDGGFTPCPCIDTDLLVYQVNDGPAPSTIPSIWMGGKLQSPDVYIYEPAYDYEGHGPVAAVRFRVRSVLQHPVACRFGGSVDGAGLPITNPVMMIFWMMIWYMGWTADDFDLGTCDQTRDDMYILNYPAYWCFKETGKTIRDWLLEILPHYHTDFSETGQSKLALILDRSLTTFPVTADYHIPAHEIEDHGSPATALSIEAQADDVANQITLYGRHNWAASDVDQDIRTKKWPKGGGDSTISYTWDYLQSQSAYMTGYPIEFTFRGMYTTAHAVQWLQSFVMRHGFEPRIVSFTIKGLHAMPLIPPRFVTLEWPLLGWSQRLLKIRKTTISFRGRRVSLECVDCQRELSDPVTSTLASPDERRKQVARIYNWVPGQIGDGGSLLDAPTDTRNEAADGDFERGAYLTMWDLSTDNAAPQWVIVEDQGGAYQGRHYAVSLPNAGTGEARTLRSRIDPGEWVTASAWFRRHTGGTNGNAAVAVHFYNQDDVFLSSVLGNVVFPTDTYYESVAFGQAPAESFYFRPAIGFLSNFEAYTSGQWRADRVFAISGSRTQVLASRQESPFGSNAIINGDFELGNAMFIATGSSTRWDITNVPTVPARSGIWKAFHNPDTARFQVGRLTSLTQISVGAATAISMQVWVMTVGTIVTGTAVMGVDWIAGNEAVISTATTSPTSGPFPTYTLGGASFLVPAGAVYAHVFLQVTDHTGPGSGWSFDDFLVTLQG